MTKANLEFPAEPNTTYVASVTKLSADKSMSLEHLTQGLQEIPVEDMTDNQLVYELTRSRLRHRSSLERIEEIESEIERRKQTKKV